MILTSDFLSVVHDRQGAEGRSLPKRSALILGTTGAKWWPWRGPRMTAWTCRWEIAKWPDSLRA